MRRFFFFSFVVLYLSGMPALRAAQNYDIKQMTPAIQQAIQNRQDRYQRLQGLKAGGQVGEDNQGFLAALKSSADTDALVESENRDRQVIYQAIVDQNQLGAAAGMDKVKLAFSEVQRDKARPGDYVQLPTGEWVQR